MINRVACFSEGCPIAWLRDIFIDRDQAGARVVRLWVEAGTPPPQGKQKIKVVTCFRGVSYQIRDFN